MLTKRFGRHVLLYLVAGCRGTCCDKVKFYNHWIYFIDLIFHLKTGLFFILLSKKNLSNFKIVALENSPFYIISEKQCLAPTPIMPIV